MPLSCKDSMPVEMRVFFVLLLLSRILYFESCAHSRNFGTADELLSFHPVFSLSDGDSEEQSRYRPYDVRSATQWSIPC